MKKIDWDNVKAGAAVVGIIGIVATVLYFSVSSDNERHAREEACAKSCGIVKAQIINEQCHCMSEHGWDLKK